MWVRMTTEVEKGFEHGDVIIQLGGCAQGL